jgi:hypothetical protein
LTVFQYGLCAKLAVICQNIALFAHVAKGRFSIYAKILSAPQR